MLEKYKIISSCINSVIMINLSPARTLFKSSIQTAESNWNYWHADPSLAMELNAHVPMLTEAENSFRSFGTKLRDLQLDEREFSLLLLMIITRNSKSRFSSSDYFALLSLSLSLSLSLQTWILSAKTTNRGRSVNISAFKPFPNTLEVISSYFPCKIILILSCVSARRSNPMLGFPVEFYDIAFLVSQFRSLNRRITQCFVNLPWPYVRNLPSFFYRIYVPSFDSSSSLTDSASCEF